MSLKARSRIILLTLVLLTLLAIMSLIFRSTHQESPVPPSKKSKQVRDNTKQDYSDFANVDAGGTD